ncbi:MAG: tyrosine-type recombinase/integrase [Steroidobacteraceae bacterium]
MALSEFAVRAAKPATKDTKLFDERGLYQLVCANGSKLWRLKYRFSGREKLLSLGAYPDVGLKGARDAREEARKLLGTGVDPSSRRKLEKVAQANTFEAVAREWLSLQERTLSDSTLSRERSRLERFIFPHLGGRPIAQITPPEFLAVLRRIGLRGTNDSAHRTRSICSRVLRYAVATGRAERDCTADLRGALPPVTGSHFAAITEPAKIGELLRAIDGYVGQPSTAFALRLTPYVFVRPGELRQATWSEFDLKVGEWRIPGERMKMKAAEPHLVPLSRQALDILRGLQPITGHGRYLFPSLRSATRPISDNTINAALRRLGYSGEEMTGHGFRSMASTALNEQGWHPDLIELQLAHAERNKVRGAYNRAQRLRERRQMMQAWADYLDRLRANCSGSAAPIANAA